MQFVKETAKAWVGGLVGALGALTAASSDDVVTGVEMTIVILTFLVGWFSSWVVPNSDPTYSINQQD